MLRRALLLLLLVSQVARHRADSAYSINVHYDSAVSVNGEVKVSPVFGITQVSLQLQTVFLMVRSKVPVDMQGILYAR